MSESRNIYQKVARIRKIADVVQKNKKGYGYTYVSEDAILAKVKAGMDREGVVLEVTILPDTVRIEPYTYTKVKGGKEETVYEFLVTGCMRFSWVDIDNPTDRIDSHWVFSGTQGDAAQALGSALTYANRYYMLKFLQIATSDDDPDAWKLRKKEAEDEEERAMVQDMVNEIHALVSDHIESIVDDKVKQETRGRIIEISKKYQAKGNYLKITDMDKAKSLMAELRKEFGGT
jgi:hypothetical protein